MARYALVFLSLALQCLDRLAACGRSQWLVKATCFTLHCGNCQGLCAVPGQSLETILVAEMEQTLQLLFPAVHESSFVLSCLALEHHLCSSWPWSPTAAVLEGVQDKQDTRDEITSFVGLALSLGRCLGLEAGLSVWFCAQKLV